MESETLVREGKPAPESSPVAQRNGAAVAAGAPPRGRASMVQFAATISLSAFLLFQVQPLIAKYILPWFGGGPAVWTACMLFFQVALLGGYTYAHLISTKAPARLHGWVHAALLGASLLVLPIAPDPAVWKPQPDDAPTLRILLLLLSTVGLPYLLLSSTAPLVQRWFSQAHPGRSPYRLYSLSNTGSLLALLSYPVIFEPTMILSDQSAMWSWTYVVFALLCGWSAVRTALAPHHITLARETDSETDHGVPTQAPRVSTAFFWMGLAAAPSAMLLATTNQMCQEVAVVPFLWVVPLALYLATFIICFDHQRWYRRLHYGILLALAVPAAVVVLFGGARIDVRIQIAVYSLTLFACCMTCHGELVRSKPHPRYLTLFYLLVSAGGALGGLFVAVAAPRLFSGYWEFHLSLVACIVLTFVAWRRSGAWDRYFREPAWAWGGAASLLLCLTAALGLQVHVLGLDALASARNFYGTLRVLDTSDDAGGRQLALAHGRIMHGVQFLDEERRRLPTAYYAVESGLGLAIENHPRRLAEVAGERGLRVGLVGLGVGTAAAYARPGDYFRFYEINPDVVRLCNEFFFYVRDAASTVDIVLGDGRIQMEREAAHGELQQFDLVVVDAFSGDAIPIHLITKESVGLYLKHMRGDGLLAFHITNRSIDLAPVVRAIAERFGLQALQVKSKGDDARASSDADWVILTKNQEFLSQEAVKAAVTPWSDQDRRPLLWTDDFAGLWQVLKH